MRDRELAGRELPLLKLSWVKHQQRRAAPLVLALIALWIAGIFAGIILMRPLMLRNDWYGLLIILWLFVSFVIFGWAWIRTYRWFGLICPYCGSTMRTREENEDIERLRRCGSCAAIVIDPEA
jgi:hypothetical protein